MLKSRPQLKTTSQPSGAIPPTPTVTRVLIVDDHPLMRYAIKTIILQQIGMYVEGDCNCAKDAMSQIRLKDPNLVITDISLPGGMDGLELIKNIHSEKPNLSILVLSVHDESIYALRAIAAGARGYINKERPIVDLLHAIRNIMNGEIELSKTVLDRLCAKNGSLTNRHIHDLAERLSDRELEILLLIGKSLSSAQIAACLRISIKTIESHRRNLREKLGLHGSGELIRYAIAWRFARENRNEI
ncbi:MAG: response regulator transcription factor [Verrucomicrobiota bacterium]